MRQMPSGQRDREAPPLWRRFSCAHGVLLAGMMQSLPDIALAQTGAAPPTAASKPEPLSQKAPPAPTAVVPAETVLLLIRSTLLSLNDALQTGNYTVLRDLSAPSFRERNSAAQLSQIFAGLASRGVDLSAVTILTPQMQSAPAVAQDGRLHVKGYFPGEPLRIDFELVFEAVDRQWHIYALSVTPVVAPAIVSATPEPKKAPAKADDRGAAGKSKNDRLSKDASRRLRTQTAARPDGAHSPQATASP